VLANRTMALAKGEQSAELPTCWSTQKRQTASRCGERFQLAVRSESCTTNGRDASEGASFSRRHTRLDEQERPSTI
jgi:hypothetical protein